MQLAFHMGFHKVALIGADHDFADKGTANKLVTATTKDRNHFDPRYFLNGMQWQLPDLIESDASYSKARDTFIAFGRSIVNATEGGKLEIFERKSLKDFCQIKFSNLFKNINIKFLLTQSVSITWCSVYEHLTLSC